MTRKLTASALCLGWCLVLPFITGQIPEIGSSLLPMHIPVLICGFVCGFPYGLAVGAIAPPLRFLIFSMPPIFPTGTAMAFELATYGAISGLLGKILPRKLHFTYAALIGAMLTGRAVWGIVMLILTATQGGSFAFAAFFSGAFAKAVPGILLQLVLIPPLIAALDKAGLSTTSLLQIRNSPD